MSTSSYSFVINIPMHFSTLAKILPYERLLKSLKHFNLSFHVKSHLYIPIVSYIENYRYINMYKLIAEYRLFRPAKSNI